MPGRGLGPTFIEAKTYRIEGHFVGDPELYRDHAQTQEIFHSTDPLLVFRRKMEESLHLMDAAECDEIDRQCRQKILSAKEFALAAEYPDAAEYMQYVYAD